MSSEDRSKFEWQMLEMPNGISTSNGNWFRITREGIEKYIPGLLEKYSLQTLIRDADEWLDSANSISLIVYLLLPFTGLDPVICFLGALAFYFIWNSSYSALVGPSLSRLIKALNSDGFLYVATAAALIYFAWQEMYTSLWLGVVIFFLLKVRLLSLILKMYSSKQEDGDKTNRSDRTLNMIMIRYGMKEGIMPNHVKNMQDDLLKTVNYHKTRKNKNKKD